MRTDPRKACANQEEKLLWALIHDGIAHPLMALSLFSGWAVAFHDWTSKKAWPRKVAEVSKQIWYHKEDKKKTLFPLLNTCAITKLRTASHPYHRAMVLSTTQLRF